MKGKPPVFLSEPPSKDKRWFSTCFYCGVARETPGLLRVPLPALDPREWCCATCDLELVESGWQMGIAPDHFHLRMYPPPSFQYQRVT